MKDDGIRLWSSLLVQLMKRPRGEWDPKWGSQKEASFDNATFAQGQGVQLHSRLPWESDIHGYMQRLKFDYCWQGSSKTGEAAEPGYKRMWGALIGVLPWTGDRAPDAADAYDVFKGFLGTTLPVQPPPLFELRPNFG